jgi:hypothetical protein
MPSIVSRDQAATAALNDAIAGKSGDEILRAYTAAKEGDQDLMVHEEDRKDLVADLIADLHYVGRPISDLNGYKALSGALKVFCEENGYDYADLVRRGGGNMEAEIDEAEAEAARPRL